MASVQDYKRRIRSVRNTRKITRAMELVAAAKLRRAQSRIEAMRPYAETMRELIAGVGRAAGSVRGLPLLQQRETTSSTLLVPLTGDRGLAGAFNAQVMRRAFALDRQLTAEGQTVRWLGVGLFAAGGALRIWAVFVLGRRFSGLVAIQPGHTLVTTGVYCVIRHPNYLGLLVSSLGWALTFRAAVGVLLTALMLVTLLARIRAEEMLLRTQFGSEYDAYRARTSRLIPGLY